MSNATFTKLASLYKQMEQAYSQHAQQAKLDCSGCPTNCCTSYFQHHTRVEWIYLLKGLRTLPVKKQETIRKRAEQYIADTQEKLATNTTPNALCPVNEKGLCIVYPYRLMICRMHGTCNTLSLPNGNKQNFSGCEQFVALQAQVEPLDRTPFYQELASLEMEVLRKAGRPLGRVDMTIAEMIVQGPPPLR